MRGVGGKLLGILLVFIAQYQALAAGSELDVLFAGLLELRPPAVDAFGRLGAADMEKILSDLTHLLLAEEMTHFSADRYLPGRAVRVLDELELAQDHGVFKGLVSRFPKLSPKSQRQVLELFQKVESPRLLPAVADQFPRLTDSDSLSDFAEYLARYGNKSHVPLFENLALRKDLSDSKKYAALSRIRGLKSEESVKLLTRLIQGSNLSTELRGKLVGTLGSVPMVQALEAYMALSQDPGLPRAPAFSRNLLVLWRLDEFESLDPKLMGKFLTRLLLEELREEEPELRVVFRLLSELKSLGPAGEPAMTALGLLLKLGDDQLEKATFDFISQFQTKQARDVLGRYFSKSVPSFPENMEKFASSAEADWFRQQTGIAGNLVRAGEDKSKVLDQLAAAWAKGFSHLKKKDSKEFMTVFEGARTRLPEDLRSEFEQRLFDKVFSRELEGTPCASACRTAEQYAYWAQKKFLTTPDYKHTAISWEFTLNSLGLLFLARASPHCEKVAPVAQSLLEHLIPGQEKGTFPKPKKSSGFGSLLGLAKTARSISRSDPGFDKVLAYGKVFYIELMRELEAQRSSAKMKLDYARVQKELEQTEASLVKELEGFKHPKSLQDEGYGIRSPKNLFSMVNSHTGSYFETFMMSMTRLVTPLPEDAEKLLAGILESALEDTKNPLRLVYGFGRGYRRETERGAAARAVPYHLSYYLGAKDPEEKRRFGRYLVRALKNYNKHSGSLVFHIARNSTHKPDGVSAYDGIAPYYYYPSVTAVTLAYRALERDPEFKKEADQLGKMEEDHLRKLRLLSSREGRFLELGQDRYPSSPAYVNPLAGLALLPYCGEGATGLTALPSQKSTKPLPAAEPGISGSHSADRPQEP